MRNIIVTSVGILVLVGSALALASNPTGGLITPIETVKASDPAKVELGKMLYFDPRLSKSGFISCNSCHNLATGGTDNLPSSIGHKWQLGPINSPTVLNAKYNIAQFWDGRAADLKDQAGGPMANPGEMASSHELVIDILETIPGYVAAFEKAYGTKKIDIDLVTDAIARFEETLTTPDSRFDRWIKGDETALTETEKEGYELFEATGCATCHNGPGVGGGSFQKMGLVKDYKKDTKTIGRIAVTKDERDKFVFKVPLLRNVELTYPYFHDGSLWDLREVVKEMGDLQLGVELDDEDAGKIVAFLKTLTGKQPEIVYPVLPPSTPKTPKPNRG